MKASILSLAVGVARQPAPPPATLGSSLASQQCSTRSRRVHLARVQLNDLQMRPPSTQPAVTRRSPESVILPL
jgi:hypothetical protein